MKLSDRISYQQDTRLANLATVIRSWPLENREGLLVLISSLRFSYTKGKLTKSKFLAAIYFLEQLTSI